jgi:hypothetical protein
MKRYLAHPPQFSGYLIALKTQKELLNILRKHFIDKSCLLALQLTE